MPYRASGFRWTDADGEHDIPLAYPLRRVRPSIVRASWSRETISGTVHTAQVADSAHDVEGVIRFAATPQALLDMLSQRVGDSLTYYEDRGGEVEMPAELVSVSPGGVDVVGLDPDPDRFGFGEYSATVRLRFADPADAAALYAYTG